MRRYAIGLLLATSACVTTKLSPEAQAIRLTSNADVVKGCKFLGNVEGTDNMNGGMLGQNAAAENAMRRMKNKAAALHANTIFLTANDGTKFSGSTQRGEAYACAQ